MTILLSRLDVERLLTPDACIAAVEDAFCRLAEGSVVKMVSGCTMLS